MKHPLREMMEKRQGNVLAGIPSYCTANELVLEAALQRAGQLGRPVLIEATANQVNQFGGYTGMKPADFYALVGGMARKAGVTKDQLILAGDHLGPLTWQDLSEKEAMKNAEELVYEYVRAGFTKIHLDTSMKLADDPEGALSAETIARRGVRLYQVCMRAYSELRQERPEALRPVFVIGSEVPIPGGAQEAEDTLAVTDPDAFSDTVNTYRRCFEEAGIPEGMSDVIAVVVQPGVEFGDDQIFLYDPEKAKSLCERLKQYPQLVFEGHSTDYQSAECLRKMVRDGIAILKVGPALTYALREALFALSMMEQELVPEKEQAHFRETLDQAMLSDPGSWVKHYHGTERDIRLARKYSFSDRARYCIGQPKVRAAIHQLMENLERYEIPMNMLHQYMPVQYKRVRDGKLAKQPKALVVDGIFQVMEDYEYAAFER